MQVDFIIVGQGLAGTMLAFELLKLNKSIIVFDDPDQPKASSVAAGMINPVVFRRMTKSWFIDTIFQKMESSYQELGRLLNEKRYHPCSMIKILSEQGANNWAAKVQVNQLENYLALEPDLQFNHKNIFTPYGVGFVTKAGRVELHQLINSFCEILEKQHLIRKEKMQVEQLQVNDHNVSYMDLTAEKVIFCEGSAVSQNPYFSQLKFKHSKGEVLEVKIPDLQLKEIISHDVFVMPLYNDIYKIGATYSWDELNLEISPEAREELLTKLGEFMFSPLEIINQKAGIRPTMHDRKPVIGVLPDHPTIGIFNGLGSKGALLAPYFAHQLAENLTYSGSTIHPEVNVNRFLKIK